MIDVARGSFEIELRPGPPELDGAVTRYDFDKRFTGDLDGTADGFMIAAGDPASGSAGYVAIEVVTARLAGRDGTFALQQLGQMHDGNQELRYEIVNGSGGGGLAGIHGRLDLTVTDGEHRYELVYDLP